MRSAREPFATHGQNSEAETWPTYKVLSILISVKSTMAALYISSIIKA